MMFTYYVTASLTTTLPINMYPSIIHEIDQLQVSPGTVQASRSFDLAHDVATKYSMNFYYFLRT